MERLIGSGREGNLLLISGGEFKHLKALRMREGDRLEVFYEGRLFLACLSQLRKDYALCSILEEIKRPIPKPDVTLYQCIPLELRLMDEVVERVSQAGASRLVPVLCKRGYGGRPLVEEKLERWKRLSLTSFKQCKRPKPMEILQPIELRELVLKEEVSLLLDNFAGSSTIREVDLTKNSYGLVVGPEGGFSREEVEFLVGRGFMPLLLKPYIYRSEMAGAVAVALIMNLAGV
ncbi:MAG: 16S rRNA (uracil(1498)-N(3))-methyltransferase [Aquificaceae bacterium]|nr:16S rRNA (uracil(1498)-N(3))-methyltransferase [Aquificaceae bacterium]